MTKCKICKQSWKPPKNIIYKDGMCLVCWHHEVDWMKEEEITNLDKWLE